MGDIPAIIEEVQRAQITTDDERMKQMMKGNISYEDMLDMFESMNQLGGINKLKDKVPGLSNIDVGSDLTSNSDENMDIYRNIIFSMTPSERKGQQKLNTTRIERIAKGSGVPSTKVKELKKQKEWTGKWIRQVVKNSRRRGSITRGGFPFDIFGLNW
jgi:signal recognition particle subunit SRP54